MIATAQNITFLDKARIVIGKLLKRNIFHKFSKNKSRSNFTTFQSLSSINIQLWNEIIKTQNFLLLDNNYFEGKKYNPKQKKQYNELYSELYDEYFLKLDNQQAKKALKDTQEKVAISAKIMILTDCVNTLMSIKRNYKFLKDPLKKELQVYDCVKLLSKYVKFDKFASIDENIKVIDKLLKSNESNFKRKFGETEEIQEQKEYTFEKQVVDIEQVLGRAIDIDRVNVLKWIEYINLAKEISKQRAEQTNNKRK